MNFDEAKALLEANGQGHVLNFWNQLDAAQQEALLAQIATIDFNSVNMTKNLLTAKSESAALGEMVPAPVAELAGEHYEAAYRSGTLELRSGKVGVLMVAGGQGTRLGYDGPKGCYPVGPMSNESLFYFHARKILALEQEWDTTVPFYIMTSQGNDAATREFFAANNYFGLKQENVFFFVQSMWPALTPDGKIVMDAKDHIFMSPDGHGGTLLALEKSGALDDIKKRGLNSIFYFQVDNPMVEICDPAFIGYHTRNMSEISIKVCAKRDPNEGLGVVVVRDGKSQIVEYTEFTPEQKNERTEDGELRYKFGSVAIHMFSVDFLVREARAGLPIHVAHKKVPFVNEAGETVKPDAPNAYKFEKFIFDALLDAKVSVNLAFDRTLEFSPVKNAEGSDSPATCKADLSRKWAWWLEKAGINIPFDKDGYPTIKIEIDPCFANSPTMLAKRIDEGKVTIDEQSDIWLKA